MKNFKDICWNVDEPEYRKDPAYSYSTLARYERDGYEELNHLFDKISTPSLQFGSVVDCILTDGEEEFRKKYAIVTLGPDMKDKDKEVCDDLVSLYGSKYPIIELIPESDILSVIKAHSYQPNWKEETRIKVVVQRCQGYYISANSARGKEIISDDVYNRATKLVKALRESPSTKYYFGDEIQENVERVFQAKFKGQIECRSDKFDTPKMLDFRCMADLIIIDHNKKLIIPCDLKTTGHSETIFYDSFDKWSYQIQARLYWRLIRNTLDEDDFYKDYELGDYMFIVGNVYRCKPLVWKFTNPQEEGKIVLGNREFRDFREIAYELDYYLQYKNDNGTWPEKIEIKGGENEYNDLRDWLSKKGA